MCIHLPLRAWRTLQIALNKCSGKANLTHIAEEAHRIMEGTVLIVVMLSANFMFSVGIIFANKMLYSSYSVPPISLASLQFAATFVGIFIYWMFGFFKVKRISFVKVLPICVAFCSFVVFTNLSLKHNSVGTYQILKCLGDPLLITLQTFLYGKTYDTDIKLTMVVMVAGIVLNSLYDVTFSFTGMVYALIAVVGATFYFMWIGVKQEEFEVSPLQLLIYQAPISSLLLSGIALFLETPWLDGGILSNIDQSIGGILASMVMACGVNITVFYIISHTSVVTYAVFSKLKTCVVILASSFIFSSVKMTVLQAVGISMTLLGTVIYTALKLLHPSCNTKKVERSLSNSSVTSVSSNCSEEQRCLNNECNILSNSIILKIDTEADITKTTHKQS